MKRIKILLGSIVSISIIGIAIVGLSIYNFNKNHIAIDKDHEDGFDDPRGFYNYFRGIRIPLGEKESGYSSDQIINEFMKARQRRNLMKSGGEEYVWKHRGPGNVGGRTRAVLIDPDDATYNTWYAASASGGVWKTTDGGDSWNSLTDHFPNLATNCIVMAPSNHNILYIGTGEGYGNVAAVQGNGIFRSIDKGQNWEQIGSTINNEDFFWVNNIIIDRNNADILLAATNTGIFKSPDAGETWIKVYNDGSMIQGLAVNQEDPFTMYAAVNSKGVIKSYDNGDTWIDISDGLMSGLRYAVDVSRADTNYVFVSIESPIGSQVFLSKNGGNSWLRLNDMDGSFSDYLIDMGWYCNVIKAHPFDRDKAFVAGVEFLSIEFLPGTGQGDPVVIGADTVGTSSFLSFVNFGGSLLGGGMSTGTEEEADVDPEDYTSVEIRFGAGLSQKAYRFTVPEGEGSGVPPEDYMYHDYIDVPFEVWDTDNNKQLMVSFRDQERDGEFNLIERSPNDDISGREYIFVQSVEYSETPDANITRDGGHYYKMIYFVWPKLTTGGEWDPVNLPSSKIIVEYGSFMEQDARTTIIADYSKQDILHVDHHDIQYGIINEGNEEFMVLEGNDGGLGVSWNSGVSWNQLTDGYLTAQVYGVAKRKYHEQYLIGMQDNGTWLSRIGEEANSKSEYDFKVGGDGFEVLWHPLETNKLLAASQYNNFRVSDDYGQTWRYARQGIPGGDGPFITRLSHSPDNPDLVFAVASKGIYRNTNFGLTNTPWELIDLGESWSNLDEDTWYYANVKVSLADPAVVWAGSGMYEDPEINIFLSQDYGVTFDPVSIYPDREMGLISGIATHPFDPATAYVMFSFAYHPKILRTTDYGATWEDISGFGSDSVSSNGFPDVAVYSLMVHKINPDWIWAGTEIGIFESTDNGETWYYADNGIPAVSIWQMFIQDSKVVVATYGRGIWSAPKWPGAIDNAEIEKKYSLSTYPNPSNGLFHLHVNSTDIGIFRLHVFNDMGRMVYESQGSKLSDNFERQFDLSSLSAGNYILLVDLNNYQYSAKITIE